MRLKVESVQPIQPVCNNHKYNTGYESKDRLNKKSSASFASILETLQAKYTDIKLTRIP